MASLLHVQRVKMLYKTILRLHRGLPIEMRSLGDVYVRSEFRRHKDCDTNQATIFMNEWVEYTVALSEQLGLKGPVTAKKLGKNMKAEDLEKMRDDQVYQLYELMLTATGKSPQEKFVDR